jgi:hypothetical protein
MTVGTKDPKVFESIVAVVAVDVIQFDRDSAIERSFRPAAHLTSFG